MSDLITVKGILFSDGTIRLSEAVPLRLGAVEVTIRPLPERRAETVEDALGLIRASQEARGYVPRSAEEVQAQLQQMYDEWEDRDLEIEAIQTPKSPREQQDEPR